jgi:hypothetical protein
VSSRLGGLERQRQALRSIAIAVIAALLGWGVGARPWARQHALAGSGVHAPPRAAAVVHEGASETGHAKAGTAVAAPAHPVEAIRTIETATGQGRPAPKRRKGVSTQGSKLKARARSPGVHSRSAALSARLRTAPLHPFTPSAEATH